MASDIQAQDKKKPGGGKKKPAGRSFVTTLLVEMNEIRLLCKKAHAARKKLDFSDFADDMETLMILLLSDRSEETLRAKNEYRDGLQRIVSHLTEAEEIFLKMKKPKSVKATNKSSARRLEKILDETKEVYEHEKVSTSSNSPPASPITLNIGESDSETETDESEAKSEKKKCVNKPSTTSRTTTKSNTEKNKKKKTVEPVKREYIAGRFWTEIQLETLREKHREGCTDEMIALAVGRSEKAVYHKRLELAANGESELMRTNVYISVSKKRSREEESEKRVGKSTGDTKTKKRKL